MRGVEVCACLSVRAHVYLRQEGIFGRGLSLTQPPTLLPLSAPCSGQVVLAVMFGTTHVACKLIDIRVTAESFQHFVQVTLRARHLSVLPMCMPCGACACWSCLPAIWPNSPVAALRLATSHHKFFPPTLSSVAVGGGHYASPGTPICCAAAGRLLQP